MRPLAVPLALAIVTRQHLAAWAAQMILRGEFVRRFPRLARAASPDLRSANAVGLPWRGAHQVEAHSRYCIGHYRPWAASISAISSRERPPCSYACWSPEYSS